MADASLSISAVGSHQPTATTASTTANPSASHTSHEAWAALADLYRVEGGYSGVDDLSTSVYTHHVARCEGTLRALRLLRQHREDEAYTLLTDCFTELERGWRGSVLLSHSEPSRAEESCWMDARLDALAALGLWQVGGVAHAKRFCAHAERFCAC